MTALLNIFWVVLAFFVMEFVAWFAHKYIMHGIGWKVHRDHHQPHDGPLQRNDLFIIIFAIPSWLFMQFGVMGGNDWRLYVGIGIAIYGAAYFYVHEVIIHNRFHSRGKITNRYLLGLVKAHGNHHKRREKEDGECFGMLVVPFKYFKDPGVRRVP